MHNSYNELKHANKKKDSALTDLKLFISETKCIKMVMKFHNKRWTM